MLIEHKEEIERLVSIQPYQGKTKYNRKHPKQFRNFNSSPARAESPGSPSIKTPLKPLEELKKI
jgi:hypothetical protein